ncbi:hypothetical protein TNCV_1047931 [Trichonephila clavipes]|nr:hypothetical protein TNCV_1047931 [Trichonephila clavipes]
MFEIMIRNYLAGLTAACMEFLTFWEITPGSLVVGGAERKKGFGETNLAGSRHLRSVSQGGRINLHSNEELVDVLITYEAANCNVHAARQLYQGRYWNRGVPYHSTFASVNRR